MMLVRDRQFVLLCVVALALPASILMHCAVAQGQTQLTANDATKVIATPNHYPPSVTTRFVNTGDINHDGYDDVAIRVAWSTPYDSIVVYSGKWLTGNWAPGEDSIIYTFGPRDCIGGSSDQFDQLTYAGDVSGDGEPDLILSSYVSCKNCVVCYKGRLYIIYGDATNPGQKYSVLDGLTLGLTHVLGAECYIGDIDADSIDDFMVTWGRDGVSHAARHLYRGVYVDLSLYPGPEVPWPFGTSGDPLAPYHTFGCAGAKSDNTWAGLGDVDDDGHWDLLAHTDLCADRLYMWSGSDFTERAWPPSDPFYTAGPDVGPIDVNGDGVHDVLLANCEEVGGPAGSPIKVYKGKQGLFNSATDDWQQLLQISPPALSTSFWGLRIAPMDNIDNKPGDEFAISDAFFDAGGSLPFDAGRIQIYSSCGPEVLVEIVGSKGNATLGFQLAWGRTPNPGVSYLIASHAGAALVFVIDQPMLCGIADTDGDGIPNRCDNCPNQYNDDQADTDFDCFGNVCDNCTDRDQDGYGDPGILTNTCPDDCVNGYDDPQRIPVDADGDEELACTDCDDGNPAINSAASDGGTIVAAECNGIDDNCNGWIDEGEEGSPDTDGDGVRNACDNCAAPNPDQTCAVDCYDPAFPGMTFGVSCGNGGWCCYLGMFSATSSGPGPTRISSASVASLPSPITIELVALSGDSIGPGFDTFSGRALYDDTADIDNDGVSDPVIGLFVLVDGDQLIRVRPKPGIDPGTTYTLGVRDPGGAFTLAENVTVPAEGETHTYGWASCRCDCHADPSLCDGLPDISDVVQIINVAFRGAAPIADPSTACPYETTDVNCTNSTDVVDVVKIVNVAFRGANAATEFCNPCP